MHFAKLVVTLTLATVLVFAQGGVGCNNAQSPATNGNGAASQSNGTSNVRAGVNADAPKAGIPVVEIALGVSAQPLEGWDDNPISLRMRNTSTKPVVLLVMTIKTDKEQMVWEQRCVAETAAETAGEKMIVKRVQFEEDMLPMVARAPMPGYSEDLGSTHVATVALLDGGESVEFAATFEPTYDSGAKLIASVKYVPLPDGASLWRATKAETVTEGLEQWPVTPKARFKPVLGHVIEYTKHQGEITKGTHYVQTNGQPFTLARMGPLYQYALPKAGFEALLKDAVGRAVDALFTVARPAFDIAAAASACKIATPLTPGRYLRAVPSAAWLIAEATKTHCVTSATECVTIGGDALPLGDWLNHSNRAELRLEGHEVESTFVALRAAGFEILQRQLKGGDFEFFMVISANALPKALAALSQSGFTITSRSSAERK